jgi:ABC-type polysaccharide/polyol phosphate transport system ATPase subunit
MDAIELSHVSKVYHVKEIVSRSPVFWNQRSKEIIALKDITLKVKKGSCLGIIGANGSGKTTLLKVISGITFPTKGKVMVDGKMLNFLEIGAGFQEELTGRENIFLYASLLGIDRGIIDSKFGELVEFSGIKDFLDIRLKEYSAGMKVRLGFATAMAYEPDILLIDEVIGVGDDNFQRKTLQKIKEMKGRGKTIVLVSHDLETIRGISDTVVYLKQGRIEKIGKPSISLFEYLKDIISEESAEDDDLRKKRIMLLELDALERSADEDSRSTRKIALKLIDEILAINESLTEDTPTAELLTETNNLLKKKLLLTEDQGEKAGLYARKTKALLKAIEHESSQYLRRERMIELLEIMPILKTVDYRKVEGYAGQVERTLKAIDSLGDSAEDLYSKACMHLLVAGDASGFNVLRQKLASKYNSRKREVIVYVFDRLKDLEQHSYDARAEGLTLVAMMGILADVGYKISAEEKKALDRSIENLLSHITKDLLSIKQATMQFDRLRGEEDIRLLNSIRHDISLLRKGVITEDMDIAGGMRFSDIKFSKDGKNITRIFATNDSVMMTLKYEGGPLHEKPIFEIDIHTEEGYHIIHMESPPAQAGKGQLTLSIDRIPLGPGTYYVSYCAKGKEGKALAETFQQHSFEIGNSDMMLGTIDAGHKWMDENKGLQDLGGKSQK